MAQTSGTFPQLSDGVRKTVVKTPGINPAQIKSRAAVTAPRMKPPAPSINPHRRGGFAQHNQRKVK